MDNQDHNQRQLAGDDSSNQQGQMDEGGKSEESTTS